MTFTKKLKNVIIGVATALVALTTGVAIADTYHSEFSIADFVDQSTNSSAVAAKEDTTKKTYESKEEKKVSDVKKEEKKPESTEESTTTEASKAEEVAPATEISQVASPETTPKVQQPVVQVAQPEYQQVQVQQVATEAVQAQPVAQVQAAQPVVTAGVGEAAAKEFIAQKESGGSYTAQNGIYYGRYQLTSSYLNGDFSPENQERVADNYVLQRYGSWENAYQFWIANGWY